MNRALSFLMMIALLMSVACKPAAEARKSTPDRSTASARVMDDISVYRPKYPVEDTGTSTAAPVEPTQHSNAKVTVLMDSVARVNMNIRYAQGYRILAYNGAERQTVMDLRKAIIARVPEQKDYLTYQQPNFRLKIGDYFTRIEAQQVLNQIRDLVPNAHVVEEQINIPKN